MLHWKYTRKFITSLPIALFEGKFLPGIDTWKASHLTLTKVTLFPQIRLVDQSGGNISGSMFISAFTLELTIMEILEPP